VLPPDFAHIPLDLFLNPCFDAHNLSCFLRAAGPRALGIRLHFDLKKPEDGSILPIAVAAVFMPCSETDPVC